MCAAAISGAGDRLARAMLPEETKNPREEGAPASARGDSEEIAARLPCVALGITCGVVRLITCQDTPR